MNENKEEPSIPLEQMTHIKTLFSRLTELIMSTCVTRRGVADSIVAVGSWTSVIFASLILMTENTPEGHEKRVKQICNALDRDITQHVKILGKLNKERKEESRIILPKEK